MISRFKPSVWTFSLSRDAAVCRGLAFSYGVHPVRITDEPDDWRELALRWVREESLEGVVAMLVAGPSEKRPDANHRLEFLRLAPASPT